MGWVFVLGAVLGHQPGEIVLTCLSAVMALSGTAALISVFKSQRVFTWLSSFSLAVLSVVHLRDYLIGARKFAMFSLAAGVFSLILIASLFWILHRQKADGKKA